jgi:hypothetical protein
MRPKKPRKIVRVGSLVPCVYCCGAGYQPRGNEDGTISPYLCHACDGAGVQPVKAVAP